MLEIEGPQNMQEVSHYANVNYVIGKDRGEKGFIIQLDKS